MEHPAILINIIVQNFLMSWFIAGYIFRFSPSKKHLQFGLFGGLLVYITRGIIRILGLPVGINTFITLVLSIPIFKVIFKIKNWKEPALISVLGYMMILFIEILTLGFSLSLFNATPDFMLKNPSIHIKVIIIQNIWILLFILLVRITHQLIRKWKRIKGEHK